MQRRNPSRFTRRRCNQQCVRGTSLYLALQQKWLPLLSGVCRFVHEQLVKLESGVGKEEAAKEAFWAVRNSGVDIRLKEVCHHQRLQLVYTVA